MCMYNYDSVYSVRPDEESWEFGEGGEGVREKYEWEIDVEMTIESTGEPVARVVKHLQQPWI